jgi:hypothetical protein
VVEAGVHPDLLGVVVVEEEEHRRLVAWEVVVVEEHQDLQEAEVAVVEVRHLLLEAVVEELEDESWRPGEEVQAGCLEAVVVVLNLLAPLEAEAEEGLQGVRCAEEVEEEPIHDWVLAVALLSQGREEGLQTCDSRSSSSLLESLLVVEEGEVQDWVLLAQLVEAQNERTCLHLPMAEAHRTWVEEVMVLARAKHQSCQIVSGPEEVGVRLFSGPVAREVRLFGNGQRTAEGEAVGELESFVHRCRWQAKLVLVEEVVLSEVEKPSAAPPSRSLQ